METSVEDKIVHQIEKNLSNNINENLFTAGRVYEEKKLDHSFPQLSRAEYIRQAREACLRQMNTTSSITRGAGNPIDENEILHPVFSNTRKKREGNLFQSMDEEENSALEVAAFRSLIIRTVGAVVIFLSIFIIDRFKMKWGDFSFQTVENFIRGKDGLAALEELIVSWLK